MPRGSTSKHKKRPMNKPFKNMLGGDMFREDESETGGPIVTKPQAKSRRKKETMDEFVKRRNKQEATKGR